MLDLRMPRVGDLDVLRAMRAEGLGSRVVVFTAEVDDEDVVEQGPGEGTVKIHPHHAYEKLQVETRVGLAIRLRENRLA